MSTIRRGQQLPGTASPPPVAPVTSIGEARERYDSAVIPVGVDDTGNIVEWRLKRVAQCLVVGNGNAEVSAAMVASAAAQGVRVVVIDPKAAMVGLRDYPGVVTVATQPFEAVALIHTIFDEMRQRYALAQTTKGMPDVEPLLLVVNEYGMLRDSLRALYARTKPRGGPRECPTLSELASLLRLGRASRIHCMMTAESPYAMVPDGVHDEFGIRLSLGCLSRMGAISVHGDPEAGTDVGVGIGGRGTVTSWEAPGASVGVRAFGADQEILDALRPPASLYERIVVMPPAADPAEAGEEFSFYQELSLVKAAEHPGFDPCSPAYAPPQWLHPRNRGGEFLFGTTGKVVGRKVSEYARGYQDALGEVAAKWIEDGPDAALEYIRANQQHPGGPADGDAA